MTIFSSAALILGEKQNISFLTDRVLVRQQIDKHHDILVQNTLNSMIFIKPSEPHDEAGLFSPPPPVLTPSQQQENTGQCLLKVSTRRHKQVLSRWWF